MQRVAVGILILFLIAVCGIILVETAGSGDAPNADPDVDRTLKFMIGGNNPRSKSGDSESDPVAEAREKKPTDRASNSAPTSKAPKLPWKAPDPILRYKIEKGDNPMKIATEFFGAGTPELVDRILKANNLKSARDLKIGVELKIPVDHFERFIADGRRNSRDVAKRYYKADSILAPLRHANPNLPKDPTTPIPVGFTVFIPR